MNVSLLVSCIFTLLAGIATFRFAIPLAHKYKLVDVPSSRRRHPKPMPIIGGALVFLTLGAGLALYGALNPEWLRAHLPSLLPLGGAVAILVSLGLVDDLKGIGPKGKLFWQFFAAALVLRYEPQVHKFCTDWSETMGWITWPTAALWLVGLSNAINLVDGLDGLAGGISFIVAGSLAALCSTFGGGQGELAMVLMLLLMPACVAFLMSNWSPARIFLGDNGSLPIGFLIGAVSIMSPAQSFSWEWLISITLMMGYPILDMGLCTVRRLRKGNPIFKADRNHLHHRMLRLGLSVSQTCVLLLNVTLYLQLTAITIIKIRRVDLSILYIGAVSASLFTFLFLMYAIERRRMERLSHATEPHLLNADSEAKPRFRECTIAKIDLVPLFEAGLFEEKSRVHHIVASLQLMLQTMTRGEDTIYLAHQKLHIVFSGEKYSKEISERLHKALKEKLSLFQTVFNIQYSLASLPVVFERQEFLVYDQAAHHQPPSQPKQAA